jgi:hypothetical protein
MAIAPEFLRFFSQPDLIPQLLDFDHSLGQVDLAAPRELLALRPMRSCSHRFTPSDETMVSVVPDGRLYSF